MCWPQIPSWISLKAYWASSGPRHRRKGRLNDFLYNTSSMRIYLAAQILSFAESDSVPTVGLFKYWIIGLLQSGASIIMTDLSVAVLGRLSVSIKIPFVAPGSSASTRESSSAFEFSSRGIWVIWIWENCCHSFLTKLLYALRDGSFTSYSPKICRTTSWESAKILTSLHEFFWPFVILPARLHIPPHC